MRRKPRGSKPMNQLPPNLPSSLDMTIEKPSFQMVRVINHNPFAISDRFDGVPFEFQPEEPVNIPPDAAAHFFGWPGQADLIRAYIAKRRGWNTIDDIKRDETGKMRWEGWAEKIEITHIQFDLVPRDPSVPIPADVGQDEDNVLEGDGLPIPIAGEAGDISSTGAGIRKSTRFQKKQPRRIDP